MRRRRAHGASEEALHRDRLIEAPAARIFAVLTDPDQHQYTEPSDWVREAISSEPVTRVGQIFGMAMHHVNAGGDYVMHNRVVLFGQDRAIASEPGQYGAAGQLDVGGWIWRYDLAPHGAGTEVRLTYDWSATPAHVRAEIGGMPPFGADFLETSLATLDVHVTSRTR